MRLSAAFQGLGVRIHQRDLPGEFFSHQPVSHSANLPPLQRSGIQNHDGNGVDAHFLLRRQSLPAVIADKGWASEKKAIQEMNSTLPARGERLGRGQMAFNRGDDRVFKSRAGKLDGVDRRQAFAKS